MPSVHLDDYDHHVRLWRYLCARGHEILRFYRTEIEIARRSPDEAQSKRIIVG